MIVGIIYGGKNAEELTNSQTVKDIQTVLHAYEIDTKKLYLNDKNICPQDIDPVDILFIVDSNCRDYSIRQTILDYINQKNIPCIKQSDNAFNLARDKFGSNMMFKKAGIKVPKSLITDSSSPEIETIAEIKKMRIGFPMIVKDNFGSSSENLALVNNEKELFSALSKLKGKCRKLIVEEYVAGREITIPFVLLCGHKLVLSPVEIIYEGMIYDFVTKNNTFSNRLQIPAKIDKNVAFEIKQTVRRANKIIGTENYSRLDIRIKNGSIYILEINGEPVLCKNDFLSRSANSLGLSYSRVIIGFLSNIPSFIEYAKMQNEKLYKFIKSTEKIVTSLANRI